jgi:predicted amidophosphoribosyltransferase
MIFATRCAGCHARGPVLCRTCRFALIARPAPGTPGDIVVATAYSGRVRDVLLGLKYHNRRRVAAHVAGVLAGRLAGRATDVDVVTWAPTSATRRRGRGFDQAELIARCVAARLGLPCRRLLERDGAAAPQTGRSRRQRLSGPTYRVHPRAAGRRVLVVDDVVTTGATLEAAERALRVGGATDVILAAVAATPECLLPATQVA